MIITTLKTINELEFLLWKTLKKESAEIVGRQNSPEDVFIECPELLAALLSAHLKQDNSEWNGTKWLDAVIFSGSKKTGDDMELSGFAIWGRGGTTEEWVDLLKLEMNLEKGTYILSFVNPEYSEVEYSGFKRYTEISELPDYWKYVFSNEDNAV